MQVDNLDGSTADEEGKEGQKAHEQNLNSVPLNFIS